MNKTEKTYKSHVKVIAVILPIITVIGLFIMLEIISELNKDIKYSQYYSCEITDASAEKQEDGSYLVTVWIKNNSSYQAYIYDSSFWVEANGTTIQNTLPGYQGGDMLDSLTRPIVPSGQTVEYKMQILPPEGANTVKIHYYGKSYSRYSITNEERDSSYSLKLS